METMTAHGEVLAGVYEYDVKVKVWANDKDASWRMAAFIVISSPAENAGAPDSQTYSFIINLN
jgi:hypothetical protein